MGILYRAQTLVCSRRASTIAHINPSVLKPQVGGGVGGLLEGVNPGCAGGDMQDPASELPRKPIPRTPVNKGKKKGRSASAPALLVFKTSYCSLRNLDPFGLLYLLAHPTGRL